MKIAKGKMQILEDLHFILKFSIQPFHFAIHFSRFSKGLKGHAHFI